MSGKPKTNFLLELPGGITTRLPWDEYRGWVVGSAPWTCPQCDKPTGRLVYARG